MSYWWGQSNRETSRVAHSSNLETLPRKDLAVGAPPEVGVVEIEFGRIISVQDVEVGVGDVWGSNGMRQCDLLTHRLKGYHVVFGETGRGRYYDTGLEDRQLLLRRPVFIAFPFEFDDGRPITAHCDHFGVGHSDHLRNQIRRGLQSLLTRTSVQSIKIVPWQHNHWNESDRSEGGLWPVIEWLQDLEWVERTVPATRDDPHKAKFSQYRITDPYLRFWYRFVQPLHSSGVVGTASPEALWEAHVDPGLDDYMGTVFEDICRDFVRHLLDLPFEPIRIGRWWTRSSDEEVDIVVRGTNEELFVAECKWGTVTGQHVQTLKRRGRQIADDLGDVPDIHYAMFSGRDQLTGGVRDAVEAGEIAYFKGDQLFEGCTL